MATGARAVAEVAEATGFLPSAVSVAARTLREAGTDLWPQGQKGGGRGAAHIEPRHLVSLALALVAADPAATAPEAVVAFRALTPHHSSVRPVHSDLTARLLAEAGVLDAADFGGALERLVELVADPDRNALALLTQAELVAELTLDPRHPQAAIRCHSAEMRFGPPHAPPPILRVALLHAPLFGVLATLWDDTRRYRVDTPLGQIFAGTRRDALAANRRYFKQRSLSQLGASGSATPENETAASPGREAAATRDQSTAHTDGETGILLNPEGRRAREKSQAFSYQRTGHGSPQRSDPYDR